MEKAPAASFSKTDCRWQSYTSTHYSKNGHHDDWKSIQSRNKVLLTEMLHHVVSKQAKPPCSTLKNTKVHQYSKTKC